MTDFDLDAYLRRIGYTGPRTISLETLAAVHRAHASAIPFENLDPLLGRPLQLDIVSLQHKLVAQRRGGFCYEQNLLLGAALRAIGFGVTDLAARVRWNMPPEVTRPRTHMLLAVNVAAQRYVVDAGFGGHTLTAPLRMDRRIPQRTPHGAFRLLYSEGLYEMQAEVGAPDQREWRTLYTFDQQPQLQSDYEMACWYLCHHPESIFRTALLAARPTADGGRIALRDQFFTRYRPDGSAEAQTLDSPDALHSTLQHHFGMSPEALSALDALPAKLNEIAAAGGPTAA
jgi:N-hydroxyarylamine O-acetyltransferase